MPEILIETSCANFRPKDFIVCKFSGYQHCICWQEDKFIIFKFYIESSLSPLLVKVAPGFIKYVESISGRLFFIVYPGKIYEFSVNEEFYLITENAIGFNVVNHRIIVPIDTYLHLEDTRNNTIKPLLNLKSVFNSIDDYVIFNLHDNDVHTDFQNMLWYTEDPKDNLCIIGYKTELYLVLNDITKLLYRSNFNILKISPIIKFEKIYGLIAYADSTNIIMIYIYNQKLCFDVLHVEAEPKALCAGIFQTLHDSAWIAYSNNRNLHYMKVNFSTKRINTWTIEDKLFTCLQLYRSKTILCLKNNCILQKMSVHGIESKLNPNKEEFIELERNIFEGTGVLVARIIEKTKELRSSNEKMVTEYHKLEKLNLYSRKTKILLKYNWEICNMLKNRFLIAQFEITSYLGIHVIVSLQTDLERVSCIKELDKFSNTVQLQIPELKKYKDIEITFDLVTYMDAKIPWCVLRNFSNECINSKNNNFKLSEKKDRFIKSKIIALVELLGQPKIDMKLLSEMKNEVRKEMNSY